MNDVHAGPSHVASFPGPDGRRLDVSVDRDDEGVGIVTIAVFVAEDGEAICRRQWAGTLRLDEFFSAFGYIRGRLGHHDPSPGAATRTG